MTTETEWDKYVAAVHQICTRLIRAYQDLPGFVRVARNSATGERVQASIHPAPPINLAVIALETDIDREVDRLTVLARGTLRMGMGTGTQGARSQRTMDEIRWLGDSIRNIWEADPTVGDDVADTLTILRNKAERITGAGQRSYRSVKPCIECGETRVIVDRVSKRARCLTCRTYQ